MTEPTAAQRYRSNLQGEVDSATLYRQLAEVESDPRLADVYRRLAAVEEAHAEFWKKQIDALGQRVPRLRAGFRTRALVWLARRFGPAFVLPVINRLERADVGTYDGQPEAVAGGLPTAERSHARVISALALQAPTGLSGSAVARLEGRHRTASGNALRAAVLGANDGLVSNVSLVMGVAGAEVADNTILITGLAGLVAGACSMAMGEWLSVTSSRELYQSQIATEASELATAPEEERQELALIYEAKGLSTAEAESLAGRLIGDKRTALDTLVREELGIDPGALGGSAWGAAATSFCLFALGAIFPVAPYCFLHGEQAVIGSIVATSVALAALGAATSLFTGRGILSSALRQLAIGYAAALVTFGIGRLVGVSLCG
jgi:VIT1/CCC1 family predicted Fe2+/Mn2+ transporter